MARGSTYSHVMFRRDNYTMAMSIPRTTRTRNPVNKRKCIQQNPLASIPPHSTDSNHRMPFAKPNPGPNYTMGFNPQYSSNVNHVGISAQQPPMKRPRFDSANATVQLVVKVPSGGDSTRSYSINVPPKFNAALQAFLAKQDYSPQYDHSPSNVSVQPSALPPHKVQKPACFMPRPAQKQPIGGHNFPSGMKRVISAEDLGQMVSTKEQHMQPPIKSPATMRRQQVAGAASKALPESLPRRPQDKAPLPSVMDKLASLATIALYQAASRPPLPSNFSSPLAANALNLSNILS